MSHPKPVYDAAGNCILNAFVYERVKMDSPEAADLQAEGHKIWKVEPFSGYVTFEIKNTEG